MFAIISPRFSEKEAAEKSVLCFIDVLEDHVVSAMVLLLSHFSWEQTTRNSTLQKISTKYNIFRPLKRAARFSISHLIAIITLLKHDSDFLYYCGLTFSANETDCQSLEFR